MAKWRILFVKPVTFHLMYYDLSFPPQFYLYKVSRFSTSPCGERSVAQWTDTSWLGEAWPGGQWVKHWDWDDNHNASPNGLNLTIFYHVLSDFRTIRLQPIFLKSSLWKSDGGKMFWSSKWNSELIQFLTLSSVFRWVPRCLPVTLAVVISSAWQGQELQQELGPLPTSGM